MKKNLSYTEFFKSLSEDTIILTPNRRLSATLHKRFAQHQLNSNKKYWLTPSILPFNTWLLKTWQEETSATFETVPYLLNTMQEQCLWENILQAAKEDLQLLQVSETADLARTAFQLLKQWQVSLDHPAFENAEDYYALKKWIKSFESICAEKNCLDQSSLIDELIKRIQTKQIIIKKTIYLIGFTELSPLIQTFLTELKKNGCTIFDLTLTQETASASRISLLDFETEILTMARFAKSIYETNKTASIACVIPTLDKQRERILQIFKEVFIEYKNPSTNTIDIINISAGKPLARYPIIATAFHVLSLNKKNISLDLFSHLLFSPFVAGAETEQIKRSVFDCALRQANINTITLSELLQPTSSQLFSLNTTCPLLTKHLRQFVSILNNIPTSASCSDWIAIFNQLLTAFGWPGERSINSEEYQVIETWLKLLTDFATLNHVTNTITYHEAFSLLQKFAHKTIFQPQTPDAPIHILGLLEAASLPFDYSWVSGMDDISWPPQPKPNPLIPKIIQRELHMPHATAERELFFCETLTQQFKNSAREIIFSHAKKSEELELQCSPLINDLPEKLETSLNFSPYNSIANTIFCQGKVAYVLDEKAPPIVSEKIRGGVSILKHQALCPFKAFAECRLHAREIEQPSPGLRAKDRGAIIHKVLELIWKQLQDQNALKHLSDNALNKLLTECIDQAVLLIPHAQHHRKIYLSLEKKRLHQLIFHWLQLEKDRPYFKIASTEKNIKFTLNKIELKLRVDRVDELANGEQLIIDYKTGKTNDIYHWFGERLEEPQLPLYCLTNPEKTIGIAFLQLAAGDYAMKGVSKNVLDIQGIKIISEIKKTTALSWDEQVTLWNATLLKLSNDFQQGIALVDPKDPPKTCTWCALVPFCRIQEEMTQHDD